MSQPPIRLVVADDDFMIARLHSKFVQATSGYEVVGSASNYEQTLQLIREQQPDLLLLDVYMPDRSGIDLMRTMRAENLSCDVILITAAKELHVVEEGFRLGVFDYLIKPFDLKRFQQALDKYAQFKRRLSTSGTDDVDQDIVDDLKKLRTTTPASKATQKGIDQRTLERIQHCLQQEDDYVTAEMVAERAGVSRSTARTYLVHLVEEQWVEEQLLYGTVGRPQRLYRTRRGED